MTENMTSTWAEEDNIPSCEGQPDSAPGEVPESRCLADLARPEEGGRDELLKHRFLARGAALLLVGPTGVGKSSLVMQWMLTWALGRAAFGIQPNGPLRILLVQAENDEGDLAEMRDGVLSGLDLSVPDAQKATEMIQVIHENEKSGSAFCEMLNKVLAGADFDLVVIDPALAYLGGDASCQRDVTAFLRNYLNPVLGRHNCGAIIVHHTNKPATGKDRANWLAADTAYAGSGSNEWANWARGVIFLRPLADEGFELVLAKRGNRLRWVEADGHTPRYTARLVHDRGAGRIFWHALSLEETEVAKAKCDPGERDRATILALVPAEGTISKNALCTAAQGRGVGLNKARTLIAEMISSGVLLEEDVARTGTRAEKFVRRAPQASSA